MDIYIPIGDADIAANREKLEYNDYTKDNLRRHIEAIGKRLPKLLQERVEECMTYKAANEIVYQIKTSLGYGGEHTLRKVVGTLT